MTRPNQAMSSEPAPIRESAAGAGAANKAVPAKPLVVEMKERPQVEADYDSDPTTIKLVFTVEKESSARNIDLDVAEKELKLESEK